MRPLRSGSGHVHRARLEIGATMGRAAEEMRRMSLSAEPRRREGRRANTVPAPTDQEKAEGAWRLGTLSKEALGAALEAGHAESELDAITGR